MPRGGLYTKERAILAGKYSTTERHLRGVVMYRDLLYRAQWRVRS